MKAAQTLIAWNAITDKNGKAPAGSIAVGPLVGEGEPDWAEPYRATGGAAYGARRKLRVAMSQQHQVLLDWYSLVYNYGIHPYVAHRAFLLIDEYQTIIKAIGFGPAKNEPGHDPNIGYGRAVNYPVPNLKVFTTGSATHFWPAAEQVEAEGAL